MRFNNVFNNNIDQGSNDNKTKTLDVLISTFKYWKKPEPTNRAGIKASFFNPKFSLQSATLEELVGFIGKGQSITPAYLLKSEKDNKGPSKSSIFISQQLWMIDIDNHDDCDKQGNRRLPDDKLSITNILTVCESIQCQPFVIYETFGSTKLLPRYRVGFISVELVTDIETRNHVAEAFYSIFKVGFPYTDAKSIEVAQLFYGTSHNRIIHVDYNAVFHIETLLESHLLKVAAESPGVAGKAHGVGLETPNRDAKDLLQNPSNNHNTKNKYAYITWGMKNEDSDPRYIESNRVPWHHLTKYKTGEQFCCEFHEDKTSSAAIIAFDRGNGTEYLYRCLSDNCRHGLMSQVEYLHKTERITKTSALRKILRCRPEVESLHVLLNRLNTIRDDYPDESRAWRFAVTNSDKILKIFVESAIENSIIVGDKVWFPLAETVICAELKGRNVPGCSTEAVHRKVKDFECYGLLIRSVCDEELKSIPGALDYFVAEQEKQGNTRHCKWWKMSLNSDLGTCIRTATEMLRADKRKGKRGCITREAVLMTKGQEEADRLFNQDSDREISKVTINFYHVSKMVMRGFLDTYGWTQEWRVLNFLHGNWNYQGFKCFMGENRKGQKFREIWPRLLDDLDAEYRVINSGLRERFNIPSTVNQGTKIVFRRIETVRTYRPYPSEEMILDFHVPNPAEHIDDGLPVARHTLRDRIKLHVNFQTGEQRQIEARTQFEFFEDWKWEQKEQRELKRREFRELVIPGNAE